MAREASFWTAETDAAAQELWRKGLSGREIATLVGAPSHSAVIGRMWRLGAKRSPHVAAANHRVAVALGRATAKAGSEEWHRATARLKRPPGGPKLVEAPLPPQTPVPCAPRPWLSRSESECAFPVAGEGDGVLSCCNSPVRGGYCEEHRAAMFRKPRGTFASVLKMQEGRMTFG